MIELMYVQQESQDKIFSNNNAARQANNSTLQIQESQLSQKGRAMLCVIEYFAKSLKVIRNDTLEYGVCKSLCNYISMPPSFNNYVTFIVK